MPSAAYRHQDGVAYSMVYSFIDRSILGARREVGLSTSQP
jgi:hypothetical protein